MQLLNKAGRTRKTMKTFFIQDSIYFIKNMKAKIKGKREEKYMTRLGETPTPEVISCVVRTKKTSS